MTPIKRRRVPPATIPVPSSAPAKVEIPNPEVEKGAGSEALATIARYNAKIKNPKTAIRAKCVECSGGSLKEVQECPVRQCALWPFRMGENPFHKKTAARLAGQHGNEDHDGDDDANDADA